MTDTTTENPYFDLITTGIGYLNRARTVTPQQGSAYECVSIAALRGRSDSPQYSYFDCRVVGADALEFIKAPKNAINDRDTKVLVRFNVGDGEATSYELTQGEQKGQRRHHVKARLLKITWAKVADEVIDLGLEDDADTTPAEADGKAQSQTAQASNEAPAVHKIRWEDTLGNIVTLDRDDPYFLQKTARLKKLGYCWNDEHQEWRKVA
ncbi:MAG: DUF3577 domain-containing protein [Gammaproteobacteria bacterium]|nr:DUF3577 domain-containing protein [Gammaproteobacteria bacterium]